MGADFPVKKGRARVCERPECVLETERLRARWGEKKVRAVRWEHTLVRLS